MLIHVKSSKQWCTLSPLGWVITTMHLVGNGVHKTLGQALLGCAIPASLRMPKDTATPVQCALDLAAGTLEVYSGVASRHLAHLRASTTKLLPPPLPAALAQPQPDASALAGLFKTAVPAAQPVSLPAATAGIALRPAEHASGYVAHPAVVDSMLHVGATLAASLEQGAAAETRVPTAIGAFSPHTELCGVPGAWASAAVTGQLPDGSATSSYRLSADSSPGCAVSLDELRAKALDHVQAAAASPGKENVEPHLLYKLAWQSSAPTASTGQRSTPLRVHRWLGASTGMRVPGRRRVAAAASATCLADMAVLQQAMAKSASTGLSLATSGAQQQEDSICRREWQASDAAGWGMVRVAAGERPDLAWAAMDVQPVLADGARCAPPRMDAFGALVTSGTVAVPRILAHHHGDRLLHDDHTASGGRTVITGGLGGDVPFVLLPFSTLLTTDTTSVVPCVELSGTTTFVAGVGSLVGAWLAAMPGSEVCLMGRTGRFSSASSRPFLPLACATGSAVVTMRRCDVAHADEVACPLSSRGPHPQLSVIHAGVSWTAAYLPAIIKALPVMSCVPSAGGLLYVEGHVCWLRRVLFGGRRGAPRCAHRGPKHAERARRAGAQGGRRARPAGGVRGIAAACVERLLVRGVLHRIARAGQLRGRQCCAGRPCRQLAGPGPPRCLAIATSLPAISALWMSYT